LGEAGFVDGRNVTIDYRWADGQLDRMATMAADLTGRKVTVILAGGNTTGVRALIAATKTIPIVFTTAADPVATGLKTAYRCHPCTQMPAQKPLRRPAASRYMAQAIYSAWLFGPLTPQQGRRGRRTGAETGGRLPNAGRAI